MKYVVNINLRLDADTHRRLLIARSNESKSVNALINEILAEALAGIELNNSNGSVSSVIQTSTIPGPVELKANTIEKEVVAPKKEYTYTPRISKEDKEESIDDWRRRHKGTVPSDRID